MSGLRSLWRKSRQPCLNGCLLTRLRAEGKAALLDGDVLQAALAARALELAVLGQDGIFVLAVLVVGELQEDQAQHRRAVLAGLEVAVGAQLVGGGPEIAARTFVVSGFSKAYGLSGLRVGTLVSPNRFCHQELVRRSGADDLAYGPSSLSQVAATAAYRLAGPWLENFVSHLTKQRRVLMDFLSSLPEIEVREPQGTYVAFPRWRPECGPGEGLVEHLFSQHQLAVIPGNPDLFGPSALGHFRLSFATSQEILEQGLNRLREGVATFPRAVSV